MIDQRESSRQTVIEAAKTIMNAARTAPKAKGFDIQEIVTLEGGDLTRLAARMREMSGEMGLKFFLRDAANIEQADAVIVVGTRLMTQGLNCAMCGYPTCAQKEQHPMVPCAINMIDVGISIGSAASLCADMRIDSRVMFSAGIAAQRMGAVGDCPWAMSLVLSVSSKSPFFDRKTEPKPENQ